MEHLAKIGIIITNIGLAIGALLFITFMSGLLGVIGFMVGVVVCIASGTLWFMLVSAYNKFMEMK